jgi:opacity protein-like surface antigen
MNKVFITTATAAALLIGTAATRVQAEESWTPRLEKGTKELAVSGNIEFLEIDEVDYDINLSFGYFVRDGWELGARVGGSDLLGTHRYDIGIFTEYNFNRDQRWVPFLGAGVGVASVSYDDDLSTSTPLNDEDGTFVDVEAGLKWFLRPYMAISTSFSFQVATKDIYATDESIEDNITKFKIGMRYYF